MNKAVFLILLVIVLVISGCVQGPSGIDIHSCNEDAECVIYTETCGDPAGGVSCLNTKYEETCYCCELLEDIPDNYTCSCENNRCVERLGGEIFR